MSDPSALLKRFLRHPIAPAAAMLGGRDRLMVIALLAAVLGLDGADKGTVGAAGTRLESALHIGSTEVGLLVTASTLVGAIATLPIGVLVDRMHRCRLLTGAIIVWSVAMVVSGFQPRISCFCSPDWGWGRSWRPRPRRSRH